MFESVKLMTALENAYPFCWNFVFCQEKTLSLLFHVELKASKIEK